jgi:hypothetical protein
MARVVDWQRMRVRQAAPMSSAIAAAARASRRCET